MITAEHREPSLPLDGPLVGIRAINKCPEEKAAWVDLSGGARSPFTLS